MARDNMEMAYYIVELVAAVGIMSVIVLALTMATEHRSKRREDDDESDY